MEENSSVLKEDLSKGIHHWHIQLFALAGAIGVGLFYSTTIGIKLAGPGILLGYAFGAIMVFIVTRAIGEMAVEHPIAGSFSAYAYMYLGPRIGYMTGWTYWLMWTLTGMAEITACGIFCSYWWPDLPQWIPAFISLVIVTFINLAAVGVFGRIEFTLAMMKIITIAVVFVGGGCVIFLGWGNESVPLGFSNLYALEGGFLPHGMSGVAMCMGVVVFSLLGCETIGITAGETKDPMKTLPAAINKAPFRVIIFYIGGLAIIMAIYPWMDLGTEVSPFVTVFNRFGIPGAGGIVNFVVLMSAFAVLSEAVYSSGRMAYTLALQGRGPKTFSAVSSKKVPARGVLFSCAVMGIGVILNYLLPERVFVIILNITAFAALWTWGTIMVIHYKFKKAMIAQGKKSRFPAPFFPISNILCFIAVVVTTVALLCSTDLDTVYATAAGFVWIVAILAIYKIVGWDKDDKDFDLSKVINARGPDA